MTILFVATGFVMLACNNNKGSYNNQQSNDSAKKTTTLQTTDDSIAYTKVLNYGDISFDITSIDEGSLQQVTIQSSGPSIEKKVIMMKLDPIVSTEVADLNNDQYPELLIFTQSVGSGSYGRVLAFSVNNGKSISQATFPETSNNSKINKGYRGHDKFSISNNKLTQEFPIYNPGDSNAQPSGKRRVVTYKLINGEASRKFVIDQIHEVPLKATK